mmetsp:Transcript_26686/g.61398  ORF Transcript_26686/g.61398 Transcript_26686/m.61398 type:complete len:350 (-) Transcript_26686:162-1211(-)
MDPGALPPLPVQMVGHVRLVEGPGGRLGLGHQDAGIVRIPGPRLPQNVLDGALPVQESRGLGGHHQVRHVGPDVGRPPSEPPQAVEELRTGAHGVDHVRGLQRLRDPGDVSVSLVRRLRPKEVRAGAAPHDVFSDDLLDGFGQGHVGMAVGSQVGRGRGHERVEVQRRLVYREVLLQTAAQLRAGVSGVQTSEAVADQRHRRHTAKDRGRRGGGGRGRGLALVDVQMGPQDGEDLGRQPPAARGHPVRGEAVVACGGVDEEILRAQTAVAELSPQRHRNVVHLAVRSFPTVHQKDEMPDGGGSVSRDTGHARRGGGRQGKRGREGRRRRRRRRRRQRRSGGGEEGGTGR